MASFSIAILLVCALLKEISGHGMMLEPPNRSSVWRFDKSAPVNYNDNEVYCGGFGTQWGKFGGKCGVCGDVYNLPHPQPNENTGRYGTGKVVRTYTSGSAIEVGTRLTKNHWGKIEYSLCVLSNPNAPESGEECFKPLKLADGSAYHSVKGEEKEIKDSVQLPAGLKCDRCVLRWQYSAGNNWGKCEDGTFKNGCGPQETFRNCADISIN